MATCKDCLHKCYTEDLTTQETCNFFLNKAEYVPVVRCGECKYFHNLTCKIRKGSWGEQLKVGFTDFCSDGERRADR